MATCTTLSWRDIPAQIIVQQGRKKVKRELSGRFVAAIDKCAMTVGAHDTDAYLAEWRRGEPEPCGDDLEQEADAIAARLEHDYTNERLGRLIETEGFEPDGT